MSRPYEHHYDRYDGNLRQQYPEVIPRNPPLQVPRRTWPPLPKAEDERVSLAREYKPQWSDIGVQEVPFRGTIDQQPMIEDINPQPRHDSFDDSDQGDIDTESIGTTSSSESSGPSTPPQSAGRNQDQRYVYIPKKGIEIPLTYDEAREPKYAAAKPTRAEIENPRGRIERPRVDTNVQDRKFEPLPPRERAPSPYTYAPKPKEAAFRLFGDHMLSPETLNPVPNTVRRESMSRPQTREPSRTRQPSVGKGSDEHQYVQRAARPVKPSVLRNVSSNPKSSTSSLAGRGERKSSYYHTSSDESDDDHDRGSKPGASPIANSFALESPTKPSKRTVDDLNRSLDARCSAGLGSVTQPERARSTIPLPSLLPAGMVAANALLSGPQFSGRRASPRASPTASPARTPPQSPLFASPSKTPPSEAENHGYRATRTRNLGPSSRATSQVPPSSPQASTFLHSDSDRDRYPQRPAPRSRATSPMPAARPERPQIDIISPSPALHQKSFSQGTNEFVYEKARHLSLAPNDIQSPSSLKPPGHGQRRRASSSSDVRPQLSPTLGYMSPLSPLESPLSPNSPMRTSRPTMPGRAVSMGAIPISLPPCPRPNPVIGYDDWYTLADGPSSFSICPSCRDTFISAGHERHLKPKSRHAAQQPLRCDMSSPWLRTAYNSHMRKRRPDIDPIYILAEILAEEAPCPGNALSHSTWYRLKDPLNKRSIHNFQICYSCIQHLETVFPSLRGTFHLSRNHRSEARVCSLRTDSKRFSTYLDVLETTARQTAADDAHRLPPNTARILDLAKRYAGMQECARDTPLRGQDWYIIPSLPEFTVCEDCYEDVVWPGIKADLPIATEFRRKARAVAPDHVGVSCQLYSPRMRRVFGEACQRGDMALLRGVALRRYDFEQDMQARHADVMRWPAEERNREVTRLAEEWKRWE